MTCSVTCPTGVQPVGPCLKDVLVHWFTFLPQKNESLLWWPGRWAVPHMAEYSQTQESQRHGGRWAGTTPEVLTGNSFPPRCLWLSLTGGVESTRQSGAFLTSTRGIRRSGRRSGATEEWEAEALQASLRGKRQMKRTNRCLSLLDQEEPDGAPDAHCQSGEAIWVLFVIPHPFPR